MSIRCDVVLSPSETLPEADCWLVIDILRATTTMCAYFDGGGKRLYPAESIEEAFTLRDRLAEEGNAPLLMGERNSLPPPGFDLGNSPLELLAAAPATRPDAVMATTNGTRALLKAASSGAKVYPVCARNANATLRAALGAGERVPSVLQPSSLLAARPLQQGSCSRLAFPVRPPQPCRGRPGRAS